MAPIVKWLDQLGLAEYGQRFVDQAIDLDVLRELTEHHLKELGVKLGHRPRLLRAIANLGVANVAPEPAASAPRDSGERRQVSLLFCDLVGSTPLAARIDPEDLHVVMAAFHACVTDVVERHGGMVAERLGDGALAFFGYRDAHEDDVERALRAGLAALDAVASLSLGVAPQLQARAGVATGTVVIGELLGRGPGDVRPVVGETPNLAARLQAMADPGTLLVCPRTRALAGGHFEYHELGPMRLKGWDEPILVWQVIRSRDIESRFEASHSKLPAPLIGREEEVELLMRRWASAAAGAGRLVMLSGEPGIGKSHMVLALEEQLAAVPHTRLRYFCSEHHANSVLFPMIAQLERSAQFSRGDSSVQRRAKLAHLLSGSSSSGDDLLELLANLLLTTSGDTQPVPEMSPQERKSRTLAALLERIAAQAHSQPLLMIFEDAHWSDPTSLELLTMLVDRLNTLPVLLLVTARPEFAPPWPLHAHVTRLAVNRLGRADASDLVRRVAGGKALPREVLHEILSRTDGVPLFIEELTKTMLEAGVLEEQAERYVLTRPLPSIVIPNTLNASLTARLDRLSSVKDLAQIGAAVGREFSYELLVAVAGQSREFIQTGLQELVRSELVFRRGELPQAVYTFRHVLVREAAYGSLLKSRRIQLHAAIAGALESRFSEVAALQPEILANHLSQAELPLRAVPYWLEAGRGAAGRSANLEAIAHLRRGLTDVAGLPVDAGVQRLELELLLTLAPCLIATQGPASADALSVFTRARLLCESLTDAPEYPQVMFWFATAGVVRGELPQALEATRAVKLDAQRRNDQPALMNALRGEAMILLFMGQLEVSHQGMQHALAVFDAAEDEDRMTARAAGQDAGAAAHAQLSWVLWLRGDVDEAVLHIQAALDRAGAVAHPHTEAYVCYYAAILHALRDEAVLAHRHASRCLSLAQQHGFRQWQGLAHAVACLCAQPRDAVPGLLDDVIDALAAYRAAGYQLGITVLYVLLGRALLSVNRQEAALEALDEGLLMAGRSSECAFEAELCRCRAQALMANPTGQSVADARALLERAVALARSQGSRSFANRAALDLAALSS